MALQNQPRKIDTGYKYWWKKNSEIPKTPSTEEAFADQIIQHLRTVKENADNSRKQVEDISEFLFGEDGFDDCSHWAILHRAARADLVQNEQPECNAPARLVQAVVQRNGALAFDFISTLRKQCKKHPSLCKDAKNTPFIEAVYHSRNTAAVDYMVHSLDQYCKDAESQQEKRAIIHRILANSPRSGSGINTQQDTKAHELLLKVLRMKFRGTDKSHTALQFACMQKDEKKEWEPGPLRVLLDITGIAEDYKTFNSAMKKGKVDVIKTWLGKNHLREKFVTSKNIMKAMDNMMKIPTDDEDSDEEDNEVGIEDRRREILREFLNSGQPGVFNDQVAQKIVELNIEKEWVTLRDNDGLNNKDCLLHIAVYHQHVKFVELLLEWHPSAVSCRAVVPGTRPPEKSEPQNNMNNTGGNQRGGEGYYPLWYNRKQYAGETWKDRKAVPNDEIRRMLVEATIRQVDKMQHLSGIFRETEVNELCFEISQFNSKLYRVSEFVHSLINHQENAGILLYEPTIRYARFPPLDVHVDDKETYGRATQEEHTEVFDILDWLREKKDVHSIIELKVPDRLINPHNEQKISKYVHGFGIEILDWRFLDMSLSEISAGTPKPRIRELHLYSSGKRAAISHWFSEDGLITFPHLRNLRIHVIQDIMPKSQCEATIQHINEKLREFRVQWAMRFLERKAKEENGKIEQETKSELQMGSPQPKDLRKEARDWLQESKNKDLLTAKVNNQLWNPTHEKLASLDELAQRAFPRIASFIRNYSKYVIDILDAEGSTKSVQRHRFRPTKVAIIDNGILSISPVPIGKSPASRGHERISKNSSSNSQINPHEIDDALRMSNRVVDRGRREYKQRPVAEKLNRGHGTLWSRIKEGQSFVNDDFRVSPWLFASDPHGTQMANLICSIDPACELYVAKVTDGNNFGISPQRVVDAIRWAMTRDVDIISMSFTLFEKTPELRPVIQKAREQGIVMMCSNHDEGANHKESYPASYSPDTWVVTACDEYGYAPRDRDLGRAKRPYMFQGLNVAAGVIPFLESNDRISGSSVATAIASGISSLIMSCARLNMCDTELDLHGESCLREIDRKCTARKQEFDGTKRRDIVTYFLDKMMAEAGKDNGYVLLEKFGDIDAKVKVGEDTNVQNILRNWFTPENLNSSRDAPE